MENYILVDFECLYDTDFGLIKTLKDKDYTNDDIVLEYLLDLNNLLLIEILYNRVERNPLSLFIKDKYKSSIDNLYKSLNEKYYDDILKSSHTTDIVNLMEVYTNTNLIEVTVLCRNKQQEQFINSKYKCIVIEDLSNLDISKYDTLYIKKFKDLLSIKKLVGKSVYVANYKFNLNTDFKSLNPEISIELSEALKLFIIDLYNKEKFINIKG